MITTVVLAITSIKSHNYHFLFVMKKFRFSFLATLMFIIQYQKKKEKEENKKEEKALQLIGIGLEYFSPPVWSPM